ncbi:unnamed protein product [Adineta ricciae]|uniref:Uncharacterized protein n=1 Tax=Adineta ricciae TaxID=249248 RepID=A0A815WLF4_ADIRI|nr:unnamed protein product [Adineta ricciae]CAF1602868.1 unnamed protein product [Adineta ricciae]
MTFQSTWKHIYTNPWYFERLNLSMLDEKDSENVCSNVKYLRVDQQSSNLSMRFPNIQKMIIQSQMNFSFEEFQRFRYLKHLIIHGEQLIFPCLLNRIHRLTLSTNLELLNSSNVFPIFIQLT